MNVPRRDLDRAEAALRKLGVEFLPMTEARGPVVVLRAGTRGNDGIVFEVARALTGLSQTQLAEQAGVTRQVIGRIEHDDAGIKAGTLEKVRSALERAGVELLPETVERDPAVARTPRFVVLPTAAQTGP